MRIYLYEFYACDEWVSGTLKKNRKRLMEKHGLESLTFSYTLADQSDDVQVKDSSEKSQAVVADIKQLLSNC